MGVDVHAFNGPGPLVLGGVEIPHDRALAGHSDADVLCHAVGDALLGAAGLGDIGEMFPSNEQWRGASSLDLLGRIAERLRAEAWQVVNLDATVVAAAPRLAPHRAEMSARIGTALGIDPAVVSVKATTTDGLGFTGRDEGIACLAVALVEHVG